MPTQSDSAAGLADHELLLTRVFDAPRPLVFRAWVEAGQAMQWWGPQGFTTLSCEIDARPGGHFRSCMRAPDGTVYCKQGVYQEVLAPERLVFTFAWEDAAGNPGHQTLVTITFDEQGARTRLTLRQAAFQTVAARDEHQRGWSSCLERFAGYLADTGNPHC